MNARMFFLGVLFLLACDNATDNPADSSGVSVVMGKCGNGIAKQASKTGVLHFASRDSLSLAFRASLNCAAEYAFASRMIDASTLSLTAEDVGDIRARCMCERELTVGLKAGPGENYSSVNVLVFYSDTISLIKP